MVRIYIRRNKKHMVLDCLVELYCGNWFYCCIFYRWILSLYSYSCDVGVSRRSGSDTWYTYQEKRK
jgi:hypothetical protein